MDDMYKADTSLLANEASFRYRMLDRMRADCEYYLGYGNRHPKYLWAGNEVAQIANMKLLWNSFSDKEKPEWLSYEKIESYEKEMCPKAILVERDYKGEFERFALTPEEFQKEYSEGLNIIAKDGAGNWSAGACYTVKPTDELLAGMQIAKGFLSGASYRMNEEQISSFAERYDMSPDAFIALGKQYIDNKLEHGAAHWYDWANQNWGTKWNTAQDDPMINENTLKFETAWDAPHPVLKALSEKFPTVPFRISWANEDFGVDVGTVTFLAGNVSEKDLPRPESARAYEMAARLWNINLADLNYRLDPKHDTYVYDETMAKARESAHPPLTEQIESAESRNSGAKVTPEQKEKQSEPQR